MGSARRGCTGDARLAGSTATVALCQPASAAFGQPASGWAHPPSLPGGTTTSETFGEPSLPAAVPRPFDAVRAHLCGRKHDRELGEDGFIPGAQEGRRQAFVAVERG